MVNLGAKLGREEVDWEGLLHEKLLAEE